MSKTIKTAETDNTNVNLSHWTLWRVTYNEFAGTYYISDPAYKLQLYTEKLLQEHKISLDEIRELLTLHSDVVQHERNTEECDK